jgi:N-acetylmuramoyl-L-alanine amidase
MNKVKFILDRAHGKDVKGKASPDGSFREWEYSQRVVDALSSELDKLNIPYAINVPEETEPWFTERITRANRFSEGVLYPFLISFHNNAAPKNIQGKAQGNEVYIRQGAGERDKLLGNTFAVNLKKDFPEMKWRQKWNDKLYKTANFAILKGCNGIKPKYTGALIEFGFMDNPSDLELLKDENIFKRYIDSLLYSITCICDHYGYNNFMKQKTIIP